MKHDDPLSQWWPYVDETSGVAAAAPQRALTSAGQQFHWPYDNDGQADASDAVAREIAIADDHSARPAVAAGDGLCIDDRFEPLDDPTGKDLGVSPYPNDAALPAANLSAVIALTPQTGLRNGMLWGAVGFAVGIATWHAVGFWSFMNNVVLKAEPAAAVATMQSPVAQDAVAPSPGNALTNSSIDRHDALTAPATQRHATATTSRKAGIADCVALLRQHPSGTVTTQKCTFDAATFRDAGRRGRSDRQPSATARLANPSTWASATSATSAVAIEARPTSATIGGDNLTMTDFDLSLAADHNTGR